MADSYMLTPERDSDSTSRPNSIAVVEQPDVADTDPKGSYPRRMYGDIRDLGHTVQPSSSTGGQRVSYYNPDIFAVTAQEDLPPEAETEPDLPKLSLDTQAGERLTHDSLAEELLKHRVAVPHQEESGESAEVMSEPLLLSEVPEAIQITNVPPQQAESNVPPSDTAGAVDLEKLRIDQREPANEPGPTRQATLEQIFAEEPRPVEPTTSSGPLRTTIAPDIRAMSMGFGVDNADTFASIDIDGSQVPTMIEQTLPVTDEPALPSEEPADTGLPPAPAALLDQPVTATETQIVPAQDMPRLAPTVDTLPALDQAASFLTGQVKHYAPSPAEPTQLPLEKNSPGADGVTGADITG